MASSPFFSLLNLPPTVPSPSGEKIISDYVLKLVDGEEILIPAGKVNIYDSKQEALEGTYLPRMIERFTNGSISPLDFESFKNVHGWTDLDVSEAPKSLAELEQLSIDTDRVFYSMPAEIRDLFGDNKFKFTEALTSGKAAKILENAGYIKKAAEKQSKIPVKEENKNE